MGKIITGGIWMIFKLITSENNEQLLEHQKPMTRDDFHKLVMVSIFELGDNDINKVVKLLCDRYGFNEIPTIYL